VSPRGDSSCFETGLGTTRSCGTAFALSGMEIETNERDVAIVVDGIERIADVDTRRRTKVVTHAAPTVVTTVCRPSPSVARRFVTTVMFVDVVDSTRRAVRLGDSEWLALQEAHEGMVRREVQRFAGRCLSALGDGLVASFGSAAAGVRCAASIAEGSKAFGIQVRAGVHSGECERRGTRLGGIVFHVGSRVVTLAGAGEVLVSRTVTELVAGAGFVFARRGSHRLRGLPGEWPLFAFVARRTGSGEQRPIHGHGRL
jgi:class 3 adenylate cyclase